MSSAPFSDTLKLLFGIRHHLLRQRAVGFCHLAFGVVLENAFAHCTDLRFSENAAPQPPGHPVLPRGRLELDLLFQRPVCRRRRHRALAVAGAAAALNIFCQKALTTANAHDRITDDFERRRRTGSFQSNFPMDRPAGLRPYGQPGPLPTGGIAAIIDRVKSSNFISWFLYSHEIAHPLRRLVKRSIRVVKV